MLSISAHTPDNTFLGFTVSAVQSSEVIHKANVAIVMGKEGRYIKVYMLV